MGIRRRLLAVCCAVALFSGVGGATSSSSNAVELPVLSSGVDLVMNIPDLAAISVSFDPRRPLMFASTLHGLDVYDISDPALPVIVGAVPMLMYQNEDVNLGAASRRSDGRSFVLMGTDLVGAVTPTDPARSDVVPAQEGFVQHLYVIDVTDPAAPFIRSDLATKGLTHTISCINPACTYAYTAGDLKRFTVIDLRNLDRPREVKTIADPWGWHDWNVDASGIAWKSGDFGTAAFDVRDPLNPKVLNTSDRNGVVGSPWNSFILHNTERPNARKLPMGARAKRGTPSVFDGNVLLVAEENLQSGPCQEEPSFQTWYVPSLTKYDNPRNLKAMGSIRPLDRWRSTFLDTDDPAPAAVECSAHYFDFHQSGFVTQAWYHHGIRILDVRDARNIKQVGYFVTQTQVAWSAYWVPKRDKAGRVVLGKDGTPVDTNLMYSVDAARGLDVLRVSLPKTSSAKTRDVPSPPLPDWLQAPRAAAVSRETIPNFLCRIR
ncbi:MAG: hypothetical protein WD826_01060 [Actinomycetota bacterium]